MLEAPDSPSRARRRVARMATTLAAWLVAFLIVLALLTLVGDRLESLPHALNALVFTGVLVPVMGNLVMPVLGAVAARWVGGPMPARTPGERLSPDQAGRVGSEETAEEPS